MNTPHGSAPNNALDVRRQNAPERSTAWQEIWLSVYGEGGSWKSLGLVPAGGAVSPADMRKFAVTLARMAMAHLGAPVVVADATSLAMPLLVPFTEGVANYVEHGTRVIVPMVSISDNVTTTSLAKLVDKCVLCVALDRAVRDEAEKTIARIGRERFIGSTILQI
jgi:hypothetical protein